MENERLHRELMLLQEQNFLARERKKSDREGRDVKHYHDKSTAYHTKHRQIEKRKDEFCPRRDKRSTKDRLDRFVEKYGESGNLLLESSKQKDYPRIDRLEMFEKKYGSNFKHGSTINVPKQKIKEGHIRDKHDFHAKPSTYVPPLDLREITGTDEDTYMGNKQEKRLHYVSQRGELTKQKHWHLSNASNSKYHQGHKYPSGYYQHGKSKSLYDPHSRKGSGKTEKSLRSEVVEGMIEPRRGGRKFQMIKGSLSESDLVGLYKSARKGHHRKYGSEHTDKYKGSNSGLSYNVKTVYSVPADRKYETISIQHKDEMNPKTQNVISTVTYKEQRMREKAKV